jgi:hypothetical protein
VHGAKDIKVFNELKNLKLGVCVPEIEYLPDIDKRMKRHIKMDERRIPKVTLKFKIY